MVMEVSEQDVAGQQAAQAVAVAKPRDRWNDAYQNQPVRRMVALYDYDPQELSPNVDADVSCTPSSPQNSHTIHFSCSLSTPWISPVLTILIGLEQNLLSMSLRYIRFSSMFYKLWSPHLTSTLTLIYFLTQIFETKIEISKIRRTDMESTPDASDIHKCTKR